MLKNTDFVKKFSEMQELTIDVTRSIAHEIKPGMSELDITQKYKETLAHVGLQDHWYPILVYAGEFTGKPISRRFHMPSADVIVQENDIVMLDSTPLDKTVWSNWAETFLIGKDGFFATLIQDARRLVDETYDFTSSEARTIGDIFDFCTTRMADYGFKSLDPRSDVGHSIFQVPEGQTVEKTPLSERLFISEEYRATSIQGIISIEPQVGRVNPRNGKMYGAKIQKVFIK